MALVHRFPKFNSTAPTDCNHVSSLAGLCPGQGYRCRGQIPASPQHHPELCLVLSCFTNAFVCKFTCHGVVGQDALTGSRCTIICPHVPKNRPPQVSGGAGEDSRDQDNGKISLTTSGAFCQCIFQNDSEWGGEEYGGPI